MPVHWNMAGEVDRYGSAVESAFLFPIIMVFILALFYMIPKIAVFKENLKAFENKYWQFVVGIELFFFAFFVLTVVPIFGFDINMVVFLQLLIGVLFIFIGFLMPFFRRNFFAGIRTPWTLASDEVWKKTHEIGGKAFIVSGLILLVSVFFSEYFVFFLFVSIVLILVMTIGYSFYVFKKINEFDL